MHMAFMGYAGIALLFMMLPGTGSGIARYHGESADKEAGLPGDDISQEDEFLRQRRQLDEPPNEGLT